VTGRTPYCAGIAGGTGSGKTTLARRVRDLLGREMVTVVEADTCYRDLSLVPAPQRQLVNFDHPDALDIELLAGHLGELRRGRTVHTHTYDFTTHCRTERVISLLPRPVILVEGILVLACDPVARLLDLKVYIDERPSVRRERRLLRDVNERGRTHEMSSLQYANHVLPMHARYVEPSKHNADIILGSSDETGPLLEALRTVLTGSGTDAHATGPFHKRG